MSAPSTIISSVPFFSRLKWTAGGHGLLRARPRSFQVTPDIPTGDERHNKRKSGPPGPTASKRVSSPPVGTFSSVSDVADGPNPNSKPQGAPLRVKKVPGKPKRQIEEGMTVMALPGPPTVSDFARALVAVIREPR
jgi:hypothetical protein